MASTRIVVDSRHDQLKFFFTTLSSSYTIIELSTPSSFCAKFLRHEIWLHGYKNSLINSLITSHVAPSNLNTIVFDICRPSDLWNIAKSVSSDARLFLWIWNPISLTFANHNICKTISEIKSMGYTIATFDPQDSKKYGLKLKKQFGIKHETKDNIIDTDIYFCGNDKGRMKEIAYVKKLCSDTGLSTKFIIPQSKNDYITYKEYLDNLCKARCVLDITQMNQSGLTLRPIEALLNDKKLITNNKNIKNYDFYNPHNIFILNEDNDLKTFMQTEFEPIDEKIKSPYVFSNWIQTW